MTPNPRARRARAMNSTTPSRKPKVVKTPWQKHGGALFDSLSRSAIERLKNRLGLNTEENYADGALTTSLTTTLSTKLTPPTIAQAVGIGKRIGSSIRVTRIEVRVNVTAVAASTTGNTVRLIMTRNVETGQAAVADILQTTTDITSPLNHQIGVLGIQVLRDVTFPVNLHGNGAYYYTTTITDSEWPDMHMIWPDSDTAGTPGALDEGCINLYMMIDSVTTSPVVTGTVRLCYVDN
jgi:hypothetical protein